MKVKDNNLRNIKLNNGFENIWGEGFVDDAEGQEWTALSEISFCFITPIGLAKLSIKMQLNAIKTYITNRISKLSIKLHLNTLDLHYVSVIHELLS